MQVDTFAQALPKLAHGVHGEVLFLFGFGHVAEEGDLIGVDSRDFETACQLNASCVAFGLLSRK